MHVLLQLQLLQVVYPLPVAIATVEMDESRDVTARNIL